MRRLSLRHNQLKKTAVVYNKKCPEYDENFHFLVHCPEHQELIIKLLDHDRVWGDTELGRCIIPYSAWYRVQWMFGHDRLSR